MNPRLKALTLLLWILGTTLQFLSPSAPSLVALGLAGIVILSAAATPEVVADRGEHDEPPVVRRTVTRAQPEAAIFEATGTAVVIDDTDGARSGRGNAYDALSDAEDKQAAEGAAAAPSWAPAPALTVLRVAASAPMPCATRDRAKRQKAWRERMRTAAKQNGPRPRGAVIGVCVNADATPSHSHASVIPRRENWAGTPPGLCYKSIRASGRPVPGGTSVRGTQTHRGGHHGPHDWTRSSSAAMA
jgi:hypothetical protein